MLMWMERKAWAIYVAYLAGGYCGSRQGRKQGERGIEGAIEACGVDKRLGVGREGGFFIARQDKWKGWEEDKEVNGASIG